MSNAGKRRNAERRERARQHEQDTSDFLEQLMALEELACLPDDNSTVFPAPQWGDPHEEMAKNWGRYIIAGGSQAFSPDMRATLKPMADPTLSLRDCVDGLAATRTYLTDLTAEERVLALDAIIRVRARHRRKHGAPTLSNENMPLDTRTPEDRRKAREHSTDIQLVMNAIAKTLFEAPAVSWSPSGPFDPHLLTAQTYHQLWCTHLAIYHREEAVRLLGAHVDLSLTPRDCLTGLQAIEIHLKNLTTEELAKAAAAIAYAYPKKPAHL